MSRTTLELKQYILSKMPHALKLERRQSYLTWLLEQEREHPTRSFDELLELEQEYDQLNIQANLLIMESRSQGYETTNFWKECQKLNNAFYARLKRLRVRVLGMILDSTPLYFVTLTWKDSVLESTTYESRRDYVKRFCRAQSDSYIANVDYGAKNGREHFHAVISANVIYESMWIQNGFINVELCNTDLDDVQRISKYTAKLSNHAVKETCKQSKIIYSRSKRK